MNGTQMTQMERIDADQNGLDSSLRWNDEGNSWNDKDSPRCRELRKSIQAHRIKRLGWSDYVFHYIMEGLGFGRSLRALDEARLGELWEIVKGYRKHGKPVEFDYDKQGRYMHSLMKQAGWPEHSLRAYMMINFSKTHWNLLDKAERRKVIDQLKECVQEVQK